MPLLVPKTIEGGGRLATGALGDHLRTGQRNRAQSLSASSVFSLLLTGPDEPCWKPDSRLCAPSPAALRLPDAAVAPRGNPSAHSP